ncbi:MAG TPA: hypothetical protein EYQ86_03855 [Bacteroidetes bacterium]|nr:hypothetical protein [Bacteroidota bacterium]
MNKITKEDVLKSQNIWCEALVELGHHKNDRARCESLANDLLNNYYAFDKGEVLFKPTRARIVPFRKTKEGARSYFIGGDDNFSEDIGFALEPWSSIRFKNAHIITEDNRAVAMGYYYFKDINGIEMKAEYTIGYMKYDNGEIKIKIHHSSIPYQTS